jgi:hypothetical protein
MSEWNKSILIKGGSRLKGTEGNRMNRLAELVDAIQEMNKKEFTGYIKINFSQGGIGRIEKYEEILRGAQSAE